MAAQTAGNAHEARAMQRAELGIRSGINGDHRAARLAWLEALDHAERHLPDSRIVPWIRSGLGAALLRNGDHAAAPEMAGPALAFRASVRAPLASLTMTEACLRLGDVARAGIRTPGPRSAGRGGAGGSRPRRSRNPRFGDAFPNRRGGSGAAGAVPFHQR